MSSLFYQVDAFTHSPFAGNPAAVVLLSTSREAGWMQHVAREMNLSETAFLRAQEEGRFQLWWFTPTHEVDLCGHATLASAHVLRTEGLTPPDAPIHFDTASGRLTARHDGEWTQLDFPVDPVAVVGSPPTALSNTLSGTSPEEVARSGRDYLVRLPDAEAVRTLRPNLSALETLSDARGLIVTAAAEAQDVDFVSRFFAPQVGVPEDPVTGSAHCALGPYWAARTGRTTLTGRQVSTRGGTVRIALDAPDADRITLGGQATTVLRGRLDA